jgi:hypothetical protein
MNEDVVLTWRQKLDEERRRIEKLHRRIYGDGELSPREVMEAIKERKRQRDRFIVDLAHASEQSGVGIAKLIRDLDLDPSDPIRSEKRARALTEVCFALTKKGYASQLPRILYKPVLYFGGIGLRCSIMEAVKRSILYDCIIETQIETLNSP